MAWLVSAGVNVSAVARCYGGATVHLRSAASTVSTGLGPRSGSRAAAIAQELVTWCLWRLAPSPDGDLLGLGHLAKAPEQHTSFRSCSVLFHRWHEVWYCISLPPNSTAHTLSTRHRHRHGIITIEVAT